jgi:hypothetical protein
MSFCKPASVIAIARMRVSFGSGSRRPISTISGLWRTIGTFRIRPARQVFPGVNVPTTLITGSATRDSDRATNAHFRSDKPRGATGKSLIVLNPWMTLNQRVPGSRNLDIKTASTKPAFAAISRVRWSRFPVSARRYRLRVPFGTSVSGGKNPVPNSTRQESAGRPLPDFLRRRGSGDRGLDREAGSKPVNVGRNEGTTAANPS